MRRGRRPPLRPRLAEPGPSSSAQVPRPRQMIRCMQSCLEVSSLACRLGRAGDAAEGVDLVVAPGQVHGLLGPRWAGKTTLLRVLAGELEPSAGHVARARARSRRGRRRAVADRGAAGPGDAPAGRARARGRERAGRAAGRRAGRGLRRRHDRGARARSSARYAAQGGTVVWATRRLDALLGLAGGVTLLAGGRVRYAGRSKRSPNARLPGLRGRTAAARRVVPDR